MPSLLRAYINASNSITNLHGRWSRTSLHVHVWVPLRAAHFFFKKWWGVLSIVELLAVHLLCCSSQWFMHMCWFSHVTESPFTSKDHPDDGSPRLVAQLLSLTSFRIPFLEGFYVFHFCKGQGLISKSKSRFIWVIFLTTLCDWLSVNVIMSLVSQSYYYMLLFGHEICCVCRPLAIQWSMDQLQQ